MFPLTLNDCRMEITIRLETRQILRLLWDRIKSNRSRATFNVQCPTVVIRIDP